MTWTPLRALPKELRAVEAFWEGLLPDSLRPLAIDVAELMQVPLDFPAIVVMLCLAGAVGRRAQIQPKAKDSTFVVTPNLWGGIIGHPGLMKSPVITRMTQPLAKIEKDWEKTFAEEMAEWQKQCAGLEKGDEKPDKPVRNRLIVNDATPEKLHEILRDNPGGVVVVRDELTGWLAEFDRKGREGQREFFLMCWNGDSPYSADRIGRGSTFVPACCVSMLGGIQPDRLRACLGGTNGVGLKDDGLIQRFQLLVWPDTTPEWQYVDRQPDKAARKRAERIFQRLTGLDPEAPTSFRFTPDAQEFFVEWLSDLETKVRGGQESPVLTSHLSKYRSLMPSLAVLFELADLAETGFEGFEGSEAGESSADCFVSLEQAYRAASWCVYLESHARRVYSCASTPEQYAAVLLGDRIKERQIGSGGYFSFRDLMQKDWREFRNPEVAKGALAILEKAGWIRDVTTKPGPDGGRPSVRYEVNPRIWE